MAKTNIDLGITIDLNLSEMTAPDAAEKLKMIKSFIESLNVTPSASIRSDLVQTHRESRK